MNSGQVSSGSIMMIARFRIRFPNSCNLLQDLLRLFFDYIKSPVEVGYFRPKLDDIIGNALNIKFHDFLDKNLL
jgi:hypothetical protein